LTGVSVVYFRDARASWIPDFGPGDPERIVRIAPYACRTYAARLFSNVAASSVTSGTLEYAARFMAELVGGSLAADEPNPSDPEWPGHFPVGCPESCAREDVTGDVYRLVRNPRSPQDSTSWLEQGRHDQRSTDCERAALSCCRSLTDIQDLRRTTRRFRDRKIAKGELRSEHGKIAKTAGPGHYSLWLRFAALRIHDELFQVIE